MIDEVALVEHLKENPMFRVGLDVFEVNKHTFSILNSDPKHQHHLKLHDWFN